MFRILTPPPRLGAAVQPALPAFCILGCVALLPAAHAAGNLENPPDQSVASGIGLISGWVCDAQRIEIEFVDAQPLGESRIPAAYGTYRADTASICGDTDNGFSLLFNFNKLGAGTRTVVVFADGAEMARSTFSVTTLGAEFRTGLAGEFQLDGFPATGVTTALTWQEASQNFVISNLVTRPAWWRPQPGISWQWQLSGDEIDTSARTDMIDVDLFDQDADAVAALKAQGYRVVCYLNAGAWEDWREDADAFPSQLLGADYAGWAGERWLDVRRLDLLGPLLEARLDLCRDKGFDGVEPDNINGFENDTGFPLRAADQIAFNRWLAQAAHARGLSIGLKNDNGQVAELLDDFDWAMTEDCFDQGWCADMSPFIQQQKSVFMAEYTDTGVSLDALCTEARRLGFSAILKHRDLDAWRRDCEGL